MPDATLSLIPDTPPRFDLRCSPRANDYAKQIPGLRFHKATESWRGPATLAAALCARALFGGGLRPTPEVYAYVAQINEQDAHYAALLSDPSQAPALGRLFPFQAASAAGMRAYRWYLNCDDRGNGKSVQGVAAVAAEGGTPALVVATKSMLHTWEDEFHAHAPHLRPHVITGTAPQRKKKIEAARDDGPAAVLICTRDVLKAHTRLAPYGSTSLTDKQKEPKEFNGGWLRTVLIDECVPHNTQISTPAGPVDISSVAPGDLVLGVDHRTGEAVWSPVVRVAVSPLRPTVEVGPARATHEHPVWVSGATLCYDTRYAVRNRGQEGLRVLRDRVLDEEAEGKVLFSKLLHPLTCDPRVTGAVIPHPSGSETEAGCSGEDQSPPERANQPVQGPTDPGEGAGRSPQAGVLDAERWERSGSYRPAAEVAGLFGASVGGGARRLSREAQAGVPDELQGGPRSTWSEGGRGGPRELTFSPVQESSGHEEAVHAQVTWLDGGRGVERGSPERSLWNLETYSGNYFANGVLVHNCHALKDPKAQQTRAAWAVGDEAERRIALTATPVVNTPSDLWGILRFLSPSEFPSRSKFRDRFVLTFENHWGGIEDIAFRPETRPEFDRILGPRYCRRPLQADVTVLPPQVRYLDMDPKQAKPYRQMEDGMIAELDGGILVASTVLTRLMRLQQLAAATPVVNEEGEVTALAAPSCKLDALVDLLHEANGDPLVVFAESRKLIELCYSTLTAEKGPGRSTPVPLSPENVGLITGTVSSAERSMHIAKFQAGEYPLILCTIGAGSEGITLTRSRTCVFLQRSFSMVRNIQAEGRVVRHGQERPVQFIDLITRNTVESRVHEALAFKEETMQDFTQDPDFVRRVLTPDTGETP